MEEFRTLLSETARQAPQLTVLAVVVWRFLRTIGEMNDRHERVAKHFGEVAERSAEVIGQNVELLRRLNGHAPVDNRATDAIDCE